MIRYGQSKIAEDLLFQAYLEGFKLAVDPFWLSHALVALNNIEHSVQAIEVKQQSFYKSPTVKEYFIVKIYSILSCVLFL